MKFSGFKCFLAPIAMIALFFVFLAAVATSEDWSTYNPEYSIGTGQSDWWVGHPAYTTGPDSSIKHPAFILDALKEKPIIILVHSSNCKPCLAQIKSIEDTLAIYGDNVKYFDELAEGSGFKDAADLLKVYSPSDKPYVPTTIFLTLAKRPDGNVGVVWHSVVDAMSKDQIEAYLKDAIYYHQENVANWK